MSYDRYVSWSAAAFHRMVPAIRRIRRVGAAAMALGQTVAILIIAVAMDAVLIGVPLLVILLVLSAFF